MASFVILRIICCLPTIERISAAFNQTTRVRQSWERADENLYLAVEKLQISSLFKHCQLVHAIGHKNGLKWRVKHISDVVVVTLFDISCPQSYPARAVLQAAYRLNVNDE